MDHSEFETGRSSSWNLLRGVGVMVSVGALSGCGIWFGAPPDQENDSGSGGIEVSTSSGATATSSVTTGGVDTGSSSASGSGGAKSPDDPYGGALYTCAAANLVDSGNYGEIATAVSPAISKSWREIYVAGAFRINTTPGSCDDTAIQINIFVRKFELDNNGKCLPMVWEKGDYASGFEEYCILAMNLTMVPDPTFNSSVVIRVDLPDPSAASILCGPKTTLNMMTSYDYVLLDTVSGECIAGGSGPNLYKAQFDPPVRLPGEL